VRLVGQGPRRPVGVLVGGAGRAARAIVAAAAAAAPRKALAKVGQQRCVPARIAIVAELLHLRGAAHVPLSPQSLIKQSSRTL
jgi:hypothetical protein